MIKYCEHCGARVIVAQRVTPEETAEMYPGKSPAEGGRQYGNKGEAWLSGVAQEYPLIGALYNLDTILSSAPNRMKLKDIANSVEEVVGGSPMLKVDKGLSTLQKNRINLAAYKLIKDVSMKLEQWSNSSTEMASSLANIVSEFHQNMNPILNITRRLEADYHNFMIRVAILERASMLEKSGNQLDVEDLMSLYKQYK